MHRFASSVDSLTFFACSPSPFFLSVVLGLLFLSFCYCSLGSVIGMTAIPECKLAREAEMSYSIVALITDYDCWHPDHDGVTVELVIQVLEDSFVVFLPFFWYISFIDCFVRCFCVLFQFFGPYRISNSALSLRKRWSRNAFDVWVKWNLHHKHMMPSNFPFSRLESLLIVTQWIVWRPSLANISRLQMNSFFSLVSSQRGVRLECSSCSYSFRIESLFFFHLFFFWLLFLILVAIVRGSIEISRYIVVLLRSTHVVFLWFCDGFRGSNFFDLSFLLSSVT